MLICIVIPHFDHIAQFRILLPKLVGQKLPLIVVDDSSPKGVVDELARLLEDQAPESVLIRHPENAGKGTAVTTALNAALEAGFTHAIQIDADGQHDAHGISQLISASEQYPDSIICGRPVFDESAPRLRYIARYITLIFTWVETLSTEIKDAMCGFRSYPLQKTVAMLRRNKMGARMTFDPEILVRAVWVGIPLHYIPVKVRYPEDGKSHFRYLHDNLEISWMHTRLILGMLIRLPKLVWRNRIRNREHTVK